MSIFFSADHHFGHSKILEHCNRPWANVDDMDQALIDKWNAKVKHDDIVYYLGDFAWTHAEKYLSKLNGHIHFILGSHDMALLRHTGSRGACCVYNKEHWNSFEIRDPVILEKDPQTIKGTIKFWHELQYPEEYFKEPVEILKTFHYTMGTVELKGLEDSIVLSHYAMRSWPKSHYGSWHLYGHSHGKLPSYGLSFDVGVDCVEWGYAPVSYKQVKEKIATLGVKGWRPSQIFIDDFKDYAESAAGPICPHCNTWLIEGVGCPNFGCPGKPGRWYDPNKPLFGEKKD